MRIKVSEDKERLQDKKQWIGKHWRESVFVFLLLFVVVVAVMAKHSATSDKQTKTGMEDKPQVAAKPSLTPEPLSPSPLLQSPAPAPEDGVYTFLQGPKSWKSRLTWSGKWGKTMYDGSSFGAFGCGFCCMANIYCTQTKRKASPIDVYQYSKKHTGYAGGGAIAWEYMQHVMKRLGFQAELMKKPGSYKAFQKQMTENETAIVLISSNNSACYWKDTPGHYVTLFLYDAQKDKVFLADSGDPEHNRHWISLKKIYRSLKTESDYQFMTVGGYQESSDQWKHKSATGTWVKPQTSKN